MNEVSNSETVLHLVSWELKSLAALKPIVFFLLNLQFLELLGLYFLDFLCFAFLLDDLVCRLVDVVVVSAVSFELATHSWDDDDDDGFRGEEADPLRHRIGRLLFCCEKANANCSRR